MKKIDRKQFLGTAAQVSCGCVMATSFIGCAAMAGRAGQEAEAAVAEGETIAVGSTNQDRRYLNGNPASQSLQTGRFTSIH